VVPWPPDEPLVVELPAYLAEPGGAAAEPLRLRELLTSAHGGANRLASALAETRRRPKDRERPARAVGASGPVEWRLPEVSVGFVRLIMVPASRLASTLEEWWTETSDGRIVAVDRRFELHEPRGGRRSGWTMHGRVRRVPILRWTPVIVEMWAFDERRALLTMTPQTRVFSSPRYFHTGHAVLDHLTAALTATSAGHAA